MESACDVVEIHHFYALRILDYLSGECSGLIFLQLGWNEFCFSNMY
jgi:hypothetical protein